MYTPGSLLNSWPWLLILLHWIPLSFLSLKYWCAPFLLFIHVLTRWSYAVSRHKIPYIFWGLPNHICSLSLNSTLIQPTTYSTSPLSCLIDITNISHPRLNSWLPNPTTPVTELLRSKFLVSFLILSLTSHTHSINNPSSVHPKCILNQAVSFHLYFYNPGLDLLLSPEPPNWSPCFHFCTMESVLPRATSVIF